MKCLAVASVKSFPGLPSGCNTETHTWKNRKRKLCWRAKPLEKLKQSIACLPNPQRLKCFAQGMLLLLLLLRKGEFSFWGLALSWKKFKKCADLGVRWTQMGDTALSPRSHLTLDSVLAPIKPWQLHLCNRNNNTATSQGCCEDEMTSYLLVLSYPSLASPIHMALERTNITTNFNRKRSRSTKEIFF